MALVPAFVPAIAAGQSAAPAAVTAAAAPAAAPPAQDWPTFLQSSTRTAATTDPNLTVANATALRPKWAAATGGPIATSPTIVGTTAYVGSWDGFEYAFDTGTGALKWKQNLGQTVAPNCNPPTIGVTSSATVSNGVLYVGGGDAYWYALNPATGAVLWKIFTGDNSAVGAHYNWSSPLIVNGFAYIGVASNCDAPLVQGHLMKVNLTTHQLVGDYNLVPNGQVGGGVWTTPAFDAATNTVFMTTGTLNDYTQTQSMAIVALDGASLAYKSSWQLPFDASVSDADWGTTPTLTTDAQGNKLLTAANKNGIVYTLNRNNLAAGPVWQKRIALGGDCPTCGDGTIASAAFANGVLYVAGGHSVINGKGAGGSINAVDPGTGAVLWTRQTDQPIFGSLAAVGGVLAAVEDSTLEVLDASNGTLLYSYDLGSSVYGAVSFAQGQFFMGTLDGHLEAFGLGAVVVPPADPNCPAGLTCQDIGAPAVAGSEQTTAGVLTVTAAGAGIKGATDQYRSATKPVTGDSQTSVKITAQSIQNAQPQAGLMVRQNNTPTSPFYAVLASPNDPPGGQPDVVMSYRRGFGVNSVVVNKRYPTAKPVSVMVQRTGNIFNAAVSFDGVNYQLVPGTTITLDLPATTLQGLAVASGAANNTGTASFTNLAIGGPVTTVLTRVPPAHACPAGWTCADIGNPDPPGDTTVAGAAYTLNGAGTGIDQGSDSVHYVYKTVTGDQAVTAQVVTQPGAPAGAEEGIVMRANAAPTSPYYGVVINPGGSATIVSRVYDGIPNRAKVPIPTSTSPAWLRITRFQDTRYNPAVTFFSTLTSTDGVNWTPVLGSGMAIDFGAGAYLAGMAATAGGAGNPPVVFNGVAIAAVAAPPPNICPAGFQCKDVGVNLQPGDQTYLEPPAPGTWTFNAGGSDIWGVYDSFRYAYGDFPANPANSPNGDGTISARVVSQVNPGGEWMKSGVMIRAGTDPQAPYYGVFVTPQHGVDVQWRGTQAGTTSQVLGAPTGAPLYVLASRYTDTVHNKVYYSAFTSTDGVNFTYVPRTSVVLNLPGPLVAGIATDSYSERQRSTVTFDHVAPLSGSQPPPAVCPANWNCDDIGGPLPPGQDSLLNNVWSEVGGGGDIWDVADSFHMVSQTLTGDGTSSAHITAQEPTDAWAKAGPMLRASTDPGSPYYGAFVTPGHGITVQWRATQGAATNQVVVPGAIPAYLRVARSTTGGANPQTVYTAYTSADGVTWTPIGGSSVPLVLPASVLAGFGITSHNQGAGSGVTLDGVAITTTAPPPPGLCPATWQCADIGGATPAGSQDVTNGTWTVQGGGGDIWDVADSFR
ncbi:MAG: PQQ-binding-like beta-propeller repeat protein, partial [Actinomycetota bacterium]|nr:PQQ-binding-like beta-propeller repeat protein [Actinomycetota bacterium]